MRRRSRAFLAWLYRSLWRRLVVPRSYSYSPRRDQNTSRLLCASALFILTTALSALWAFGIPNLQRLNIRLGLSLFDYGFYGFYPTRQYVTLQQESPDVELALWDSRCSSQYTLLAPHGPAHPHDTPMILDSRGDLVWVMDSPSETVQDLGVQEYRGEKFLTYWHGVNDNGHGRGRWSMLDSSYTHRFDVTPVGNFEGDLHDFHITENGTALITIYEIIPADLSALGGPEMGYIYDGVFQEVDIATGNLIFEWHLSHHVPYTTSYMPLKATGRQSTNAYDAYHINSIDKDRAGNYLLSSRHTHSIISIDGQTGEVLWTLGGELNDFKDASEGHATDFAWQHDARWQDDHTLTLLDNTAESFLNDPTQTRGMVIDLDVPNREASLRAEFIHPESLRSLSQGNMQVLPESGNVFIGWGHCAAFTEFSPDGEPLCDTHFGPSQWFGLGQVYSYRIKKAEWVGKPDTVPVAVVVDDSVFVSWNGATEVAAWRLEVAGDNLEKDGQMQFSSIFVAPKEDFETEIELGSDFSNAYFRVVALDDRDNAIGMTSLLGKAPGDVPSLRILCAGFLSLPFIAQVSFFMIGCSVTLLLYWTWRAFSCCRQRRYEQYQLVSLSSSEEQVF